MQKLPIVIIVLLTAIVSYGIISHISNKDEAIDPHQAKLDDAFNDMENALAAGNREFNDNDFIFNIENDEYDYIPIGELTISNDTWSEHYNTTDEYIVFDDLDRNSTYIIESHGKVMKATPDGSFSKLTMYVI